MKSFPRVVGGCTIVAFALAATGCIFVASRKSGYEEVELARSQAQLMSARVELERINLEREKAGLPRVNVPCGDPTGTAPAPSTATPAPQP